MLATETASAIEGLTYSRQDIVLLLDEDGRIVDSNERALDTYGYTREELLRLSIRDLHAASGYAVVEKLHRRKDGTCFPVKEGSGFLEAEGQRYRASIIRDVGASIDSERELRRTTRALRLLSSCCRTVIQAEDELRLFHDTCRIITEVGGYPMAWIGLAEYDERRSVRTAAASGRGAAAYLAKQATTWNDEVHGSGPTGTCIREGRTSVRRHSDADHDFGSSNLALPLCSEGRVIGSLSIYASEPDAFDTEETRLLEELAANLSFGLQARRRQFRTVFESTNDGIVILDIEGRILEANEVVCRRLGYTREEFLQMNWRQIDHSVNTAAFETSGGIVEAVNVRKDGSEVPVEVSCRMFEYRGKPAILGMTRDIAERKRAQSEFERSKIQAEAVSRAKSEFLTRISHEMRAPMNGITGMTNLLLNTPLSPEQQEFAEIAHRSAQGLLAMVDDILDLSIIEAGGMEIELAAFDIVDCVREAGGAMASQAREKGLEFEFYSSVPLRMVKGDAARLRQIVLNLVGNAIQFTDLGSVQLLVGSSELPDGRAMFQISVKDTGIASPVIREHTGTGLGLAISHRLAERMSGTLTVSSEPGHGSEFVLALPLFCINDVS